MSSSHPVWVRGLKLFRLPMQASYNVAPRVGAWIETTSCSKACALFAVAPRVGAWIETQKEFCGACKPLSHPVWVRGLKLDHREPCVKCYRVAPCVGAWIETSMITMQGTTQNVAPCVVRGLKLRQQTTPSSSRRRTLCGCVD